MMIPYARQRYQRRSHSFISSSVPKKIVDHNHTGILLQFTKIQKIFGKLLCENRLQPLLLGHVIFQFFYTFTAFLVEKYQFLYPLFKMVFTFNQQISKPTCLSFKLYGHKKNAQHLTIKTSVFSNQYFFRSTQSKIFKIYSKTFFVNYYNIYIPLNTQKTTQKYSNFKIKSKFNFHYYITY